MLSVFAWVLLSPVGAHAQSGEVPRTEGLLAPHEEATLLARLELVAGQTLHGAAQGLFIVGIADETGVAPVTSLVGGLAGGVGSFYFTRKGISQGPAMAINAGTYWGMANGLFFFLPRGELRTEARWGSMLVFTTAGTGLGILIASELRPRAGQVALTNSAGFWSGAVATYLLMASNQHREPRLFSLIQASTDAGLLGGMVLSIFLPTSRLRMLLIDVGGVLGTLFGAGLSVVLANDFDLPTFGACAAGSTLAGLALATYLTRDVDRNDAPAVSLMPLVGRKGELGLMMGARF